MIAPLTIDGKTFRVTRKAEGDSLRTSIRWTATCPTMFSMEDAANLQRSCGFNPEGYGFESFHITRVTHGYRADWSCSGSCD